MTRKCKIAVVAACPFPYARGTPIRILRMAEGLAAHGHEVHVITYHLGTEMDELPFTIHRIPNVPTYHRLLPGPTYQKLVLLDMLLALKLFKVVHGAGFDVIHAHHFEGLLSSLPVARLNHIPIVFDVHTLLKSELPHYSMGLPRKLLERIGNIFDHLLPHHADHIVSVTNLIRKRLIDEIRIPAERVTTVYGGVEAEHFSLPDSSKPDPTQKTLIYTGNLAPYQGIDLMLQAFHQVVAVHPNVRLKIITNSSIDPYANLIYSLGLQENICVEDASYFEIPHHLHSADVALHPRVHSDGLPLKLLNYMATGRAIVSFEGSAESLEHERTGLIVSNHNVEGFAAAILRLLDDPQLASQLGSQAQSHVQEFFVWEKSIQILETIYTSLKERRP